MKWKRRKSKLKEKDLGNPMESTLVIKCFFWFLLGQFICIFGVLFSWFLLLNCNFESKDIRPILLDYVCTELFYFVEL